MVMFTLTELQTIESALINQSKVPFMMGGRTRLLAKVEKEIEQLKQEEVRSNYVSKAFILRKEDDSGYDAHFSN